MNAPEGRQEAPAPGPAAAEAALIERQLDRLEGLVGRLKVAYQRFFNGDLTLAECQQVQDEIRLALRALRNAKLQRSLDRFRLGALEARFNSYAEMYNRRLRLIEEGRSLEPREKPHQRRGPDVERGVVVADAASEEDVAALFQGLRDRTGRAPSADLGAFRAYLERQVQEIRSKTGCAAVQFRLVTEEGKVKIKARPIRGASPSP